MSVDLQILKIAVQPYRFGDHECMESTIAYSIIPLSAPVKIIPFLFSFLRWLGVLTWS